MIETEQDMIKRLEQDKVEMAESRNADIEKSKPTTKEIIKNQFYEAKERELGVKMKEEKPRKTTKDMWVLRLYVAGQTPKALTALQI